LGYPAGCSGSEKGNWTCKVDISSTRRRCRLAPFGEAPLRAPVFGLATLLFSLAVHGCLGSVRIFGLKVGEGQLDLQS
jgi:hypothetical protein